MTQLSINTTQNVNINFTAASVGDRIVAQLLDILVMIAYAIVVGIFLSWSGLEASIKAMDNWSSMAVYILI
ncbi:MAG: RDD family protein, partial [Bacilli bacterium]|nr:RDD family protein [Bacilli bacterium]